jgi:hypothetical protein
MLQTKLLHRSETGGRRYLARRAEPEQVFIRHEPSAASVGQAAELGIAEFLIRGVCGPEHLGLLRPIGTFVDGR